jgi:hypothetical protein
LAQGGAYYYTEGTCLRGDVMKNSTTTQTAQSTKDIMQGAAIIDEKGKETPITDEMVEKALKRILQAAQS